MKQPSLHECAFIVNMRANTKNSLVLLYVLTLCLHLVLVQCLADLTYTDAVTEQGHVTTSELNTGGESATVTNLDLHDHLADAAKRLLDTGVQGVRGSSSNKNSERQKKTQRKKMQPRALERRREDACLTWTPILNVTADGGMRSIATNYCLSAEHQPVPSTKACVYSEKLKYRFQLCTVIQKPLCMYTFENLTADTYTIELKPICMCFDRRVYGRECLTYIFRKSVILEYPSNDNLSTPATLLPGVNPHPDIGEIVLIICGVSVCIVLIIVATRFAKKICCPSSESRSSSDGAVLLPDDMTLNSLPSPNDQPFTNGQTPLELPYYPSSSTSQTTLKSTHHQSSSTSQTTLKSTHHQSSSTSQTVLKSVYHQSSSSTDEKETSFIDSEEQAQNEPLLCPEMRHKPVINEDQQSPCAEQMSHKHKQSNLELEQPLVKPVNTESQHSATDLDNCQSGLTLTNQPINSLESSQSAKARDFSKHQKGKSISSASSHGFSIQSHLSDNKTSNPGHTPCSEPAPGCQNELRHYLENFHGILRPQPPVDFIIPENRIAVPHHLILCNTAKNQT